LLAYIHASSPLHIRQMKPSNLKVCIKKMYTSTCAPQRQFITNLSYVGKSLSSWPDQMLMVCVVIVILMLKNIQTLAKHVYRPCTLPNYCYYYTSVSGMVLSYSNFEELCDKSKYDNSIPCIHFPKQHQYTAFSIGITNGTQNPAFQREQSSLHGKPPELLQNGHQEKHKKLRPVVRFTAVISPLANSQT